MTRNKLESLETAGKLEGEKTKMRTRDKYLDGQTAWQNGDKSINLIRASRDRIK